MTSRTLTSTILVGALLACSDSGGNGAPTESSDGSQQVTPGGSFAAAAKEELPGLGHKFRLLFAMMDDQDPQNVTNDVISVLTNATTIGVARRDLPPGIRIEALDHQLNLKYFFPVRSCGGGSPRFQVQIDGNGDGKFDQFPGGPDQNAFGYVGHAPFGTGASRRSGTSST